MPKQINFIKDNIITWQNSVSVFKNHLLVEFGKYQSDKNFEKVQELTQAMIEVTKFESWVLEKLLDYASMETNINRSQVEADLRELNHRLWLFVMPYKNQKSKDQFVNSISLNQYK